MSNRQSELLTKVLAKLYAEKEARMRAESNCQLYTRTYAEEIVRLKKQADESVNLLKNELQARERNYARKIAKFKAAAIGQTAKNKAKLEEKLANSEKVRQRAEEKAATEAETKTRLQEQLNAYREKIATLEETINTIKAETKYTVNRIETEFERKGQNYEKLLEEAQAKADAEAESRIEIQQQLAAERRGITQLKGQLTTETRAKVRAEHELQIRTAAGERAEQEIKLLKEQIERIKTNATETVRKFESQTVKRRTALENQLQLKQQQFKKTISKIRLEAKDTITRKQRQLEHAAAGKVAEVKSAAKGQIDSYREQVIQAGKKAEEKAGALSAIIAEAKQHARAGNIHPRRARDIMRTDIVWALPQESIGQVLVKIRKHKTDYIAVGQNGRLAGIVSNSDLSAATSPYLRPEFAKWRRPMDEATLQIRVKWVMNTQPRCVNEAMPFEELINVIRRNKTDVLVVLDNENNAKGLITVFDVLTAMQLPQINNAKPEPQILRADGCFDNVNKKHDRELDFAQEKADCADSKRVLVT